MVGARVVGAVGIKKSPSARDVVLPAAAAGGVVGVGQMLAALGLTQDPVVTLFAFALATLLHRVLKRTGYLPVLTG